MLKVLAVISIAGVVLAQFPPTIPVATLHTVAFNAAAAGLSILYIVVARGLDRGRGWAAAAVRPLLVLIGALGISSVLVALGDGTLRIPFEAVLAIWAWLGPPDAPPIPRPERRSASILSAVVALMAVMLFGHSWFGWGGLLDVHEPDLSPAIAADCGEPGAGPPPSITVTYDWSWRSSSPLPSGIDIVVMGWTGADAEGRPIYVVGEIPESGAGIYPGIQGYPSIAMANQVADESEGSFRWGIELDEQQHKAGHVEVQLTRARELPPVSHSLTITATYIHLGLWPRDTTLTCSW